jgi:hypothetical protein
MEAGGDFKNLFQFLGEPIQSDLRQCSSDHCLAGIGVPFVVSV